MRIVGMAKSPRDSGSQHERDAITAQPDAHSQRLLLSRPEHTSNKHPGRPNTSLQRAQNETKDHYPSKVLCTNGGNEYDAPANQHHRDELANRQLLQAERGWV